MSGSDGQLDPGTSIFLGAVAVGLGVWIVCGAVCVAVAIWLDWIWADRPGAPMRAAATGESWRGRLLSRLLRWVRDGGEPEGSDAAAALVRTGDEYRALDQADTTQHRDIQE